MMMINKFYCDKCGKEISKVVAGVRRVQLLNVDVHLCYECSLELLSKVRQHREEMEDRFSTEEAIE